MINLFMNNTNEIVLNITNEISDCINKIDTNSINQAISLINNSAEWSLPKATKPIDVIFFVQLPNGLEDERTFLISLSLPIFY